MKSFLPSAVGCKVVAATGETKMKNITLVKDLSLSDAADVVKDKSVNQLFDSSFRKIVEVCLRNNAVLLRHRADVPITVYCVSGKGTFTAGKELEESQELHAGILITLEAGIEHEVVADPEIQLLVTKFKSR